MVYHGRVKQEHNKPNCSFYNPYGCSFFPYKNQQLACGTPYHSLITFACNEVWKIILLASFMEPIGYIILIPPSCSYT